MKKIGLLILILFISYSCGKPEPKISRINYWYIGNVYRMKCKFKPYSVDTILDNNEVKVQRKDNEFVYKLQTIINSKKISKIDTIQIDSNYYYIKKSEKISTFKNQTVHYYEVHNIENIFLCYDLLFSSSYGIIAYNSCDGAADGYLGFKAILEIRKNNNVAVKFDSNEVVELFWKYQTPLKTRK